MKRQNNFLLSLLRVMATVIILIVVMVSQVHAKMYHIMHFKHMQFIVCQLYFNEALLKKKKSGSNN